jgi:hypothetical protein
MCFPSYKEHTRKKHLHEMKHIRATHRPFWAVWMQKMKVDWKMFLQVFFVKISSTTEKKLFSRMAFLNGNRETTNFKIDKKIEKTPACSIKSWSDIKIIPTSKRINVWRKKFVSNGRRTCLDFLPEGIRSKRLIRIILAAVDVCCLKNPR